MNKKGQFFVGGLIDATTLPKWILYPMLILICLILLITIVFICSVSYSCIFKDKCVMPFYYPIVVSSYSQSKCFVNGIETNCSR